MPRSSVSFCAAASSSAAARSASSSARSVNSSGSRFRVRAASPETACHLERSSTSASAASAPPSTRERILSSAATTDGWLSCSSSRNSRSRVVSLSATLRCSPAAGSRCLASARGARSLPAAAGVPEPAPAEGDSSASSACRTWSQTLSKLGAGRPPSLAKAAGLACRTGQTRAGCDEYCRPAGAHLQPPVPARVRASNPQPSMR